MRNLRDIYEFRCNTGKNLSINDKSIRPYFEGGSCSNWENYDDGWLGCMSFGTHCYRVDQVLPEMESFLGGKVKDIFDVYTNDLNSDLLFVIEREDGTIEGSFLHCNYKMVWADFNDFIHYLSSKGKTDELIATDDLDRFLGIDLEET